MGKKKPFVLDEHTPVLGGDVVIISGEKYPISPELLGVKDTYDRLTDKQRLWVDQYLVNRNATLSAKNAGYAGNDGTLRRMGKENKDKLQGLIDVLDHYAKDLIMAVTEITGIYSFWGETLVDPKQSMRDRLKASELLARALGAFDGENPDNVVNINMNSKTDEIDSAVLEAFIIANTVEGEVVPNKPTPAPNRFEQERQREQ